MIHCETICPMLQFHDNDRHQAVIWTNIVISNHSEKFQWNRKQYLYIFIGKNVFENVVCEMAAILPRPRCV